MRVSPGAKKKALLLAHKTFCSEKTEPGIEPPTAMIRRIALLVTLAIHVGCHGPKSPEELKKDECAKLTEPVALYRPGEKPNRPYRVVTEVGAMWFGSAASRTRTLQVKACQLGADAVIDVTTGAHDSGRGLAIVYVDDVHSAGLPGVGEGLQGSSSTILDQAAAIPSPARPRSSASPQAPRP